jgi:Ca2+-binding RTX toxin-like protein
LIFAGNGNDILNVSGSSVGNVLVAGGGMDRLIGGQGRDIMIGGAGLSTLQAGDPPATNLAQGGAILIGGTTNYDSDANALASLLAEWGSANDYATRMAHLTGMMSGGLNGGYLLKASTTHNSTDTVHDNGLMDKLYGGAGMDWYFQGMMDVYFNKTTDETVTPIS